MVLQLILNIGHGLNVTLRILQIAFEPLQGDAQDIAMMEPGVELILRKLQPQAMQQFQILGP